MKPMAISDWKPQALSIPKWKLRFLPQAHSSQGKKLLVPVHLDKWWQLCLQIKEIQP